MDPSAQMLSSIVPVLIVMLIPIAGVFAAIMPYLMPKRECFAVTIPDGAQKDPSLRSLKHRYSLIMIVLTIVFTVICIGAASGGASLMTISIVVSGIGICIACYGLMLYFRSKVQAIKRDRGWKAEAKKSTAVVGTADLPRPLSQRWDLLFIPFVLACIFLCVAGYGSMPEEIPVKFGMGGDVTTYIHKSPLSASFPALIAIFIDGFLAFSHWTMLRSKKYADPAAPAQSAWAYAMFLHAQTILIVVSGVLLGGVALSIALSFVGILTIGQAAAVSLVLILMVAAMSMVVSVVYGQNGSRLIASASTTSDVILRDNDRFWKLGIFYVNSEDPALFLPERFGIGWTINWGRPAALGILAVVVALIIAFIVFVIALA